MRGLLYFIFFLLNFICSYKTFCQTLADTKPLYKLWALKFSIEKIVYTPQSTVFHLKYTSSDDAEGFSIYGAKHENHWVLVNVANDKELIHAQKIKNFLINGKTDFIYEKYDFDTEIEESHYYYPQGITISCEIHFPPLPKHVKKVHLLQGVKNKMHKKFFNAYYIITDRDKLGGAPQKPKAPLLQPPQKPAYPEESQVRM